MQRNQQWISSRCDYILGTDRRLFKKVSIKDPIHYFYDHLMVLGILTSSHIKDNRRYLYDRKIFPLKLGRGGPMRKTDALFKESK
jgi:hypothetical protein